MRKSRCKTQARHFHPKLSAIALGILHYSASLAAPAENALPTGGVVSAGSASIQQADRSLLIQQQSNRAVIDWNTSVQDKN